MPAGAGLLGGETHRPTFLSVVRCPWLVVGGWCSVGGYQDCFGRGSAFLAGEPRRPPSARGGIGPIRVIGPIRLIHCGGLPTLDTFPPARNPGVGRCRTDTAGAPVLFAPFVVLPNQLIRHNQRHGLVAVCTFFRHATGSVAFHTPMPNPTERGLMGAASFLTDPPPTNSVPGVPANVCRQLNPKPTNLHLSKLNSLAQFREGEPPGEPVSAAARIRRRRTIPGSRNPS
jgi:hypothetical protein